MYVTRIDDPWLTLPFDNCDSTRPRGASISSSFSTLLRPGRTHAKRVAVTLPNGARYRYDELARRAALVRAFWLEGYPGSCGEDSLCPAPPAQVTSLQEEMLRK